MNRSVMISKAFFAGILLCSLAIFNPAARGDTQTNVFTGTLLLQGDISEFFDVSGNPLPGVCVSNSPAPSIPGQTVDANGNGTAGLGRSPVGVLGSQTGQYHPSGFNQRRLIAAYNPNVNGGTIFVGVDLPGGSGTAANPDYMDPLTCGGAPPCPTSITPPIQRGSVRPFDADGNGDPQSIGTNVLEGTGLTSCNLVTTDSVVDIFTCGDAAGASGASDDPSDSFNAPGAKESYTLTILFTNGANVTVDYFENNSTASGHAAVNIGGTAGFGAAVSMSSAGVPLGYDVEFAVTNVNAAVDDPCARLRPTVTVTSGSNADGPAQGEPTGILRCQYVLPTTVQCQVLLYTNDVQVVTNLCGQSAYAGINIGDTIEARVVVTAGAGNAQNLLNVQVQNIIAGVTNTVVIPGPLAPGQSVTNSLGSFTCEMPGAHGVMAVVNAEGDVSSDCSPVMSECDTSFECCGTPGVSVTKLVACRPAGGACALASGYGKIATGTVTQTQSPAFCYSILVSNTGNVSLNLSNVSDNVLGDLTTFFPSILPPNGTAIQYFVGAYTNDTVNSVIVSGNALVAENITTNVVATDNAMVHVVPAGVSCEKLVSTNGVDFSDHVSVLADGNPHDVTYEVIVTASTNSPLANVTVTDPTLVGLGCTNPPPFSLAAGAQTNLILCTVPAGCREPMDETNTVSVSANVDSTVAPFICALDSDGQPITVGSSCQAVVSCIGTSSITVVKNVICQPAIVGGPTPGIVASGAFTDPYAGQKSAIGVVVGGVCPSFSYRVIVINNGQLPLNNVTVSDTLGGTLTVPGTLAPGASATNTYTETLCSNIVNVVTANGIGTDSSSVTATDSASVTIESASMSCTELVSTDGVNFASSATILQDGNSHQVIYQLTVQNNSGSGLSLTGFTVSDLIGGCLGSAALPASLESGSSFTITCTNQLNCANVPQGGLTDTATVSAQVSADSGVVCLTSNTVSTSCSAVVNCVCVPQIAVSKAVACVAGTTSPSALPGSAYGPTATGVADGPQCPTFAYRIIVSNTGSCPLTSVTVVDPLFGGALPGYPSSLAPGAVVTNFFSKSLCAGTVNTVVASGISASTSSSVSATNSASVTVLNASMSCTKLVSTDGVNFASSATIVQDGNAHQVIYQLTVQNTSSAGVLLSGFSVSDANGCLGSVALPASLASSASFTISCTNQLNCNSIPNGTLTDTATVTANVDSQGGSYCVTGSNGLPVSVSTFCSAFRELHGPSMHPEDYRDQERHLPAWSRGSEPEGLRPMDLQSCLLRQPVLLERHRLQFAALFGL